MVTFKTGGEAPYIEEGWYTATLTQLEERDSTNPAFPGVRVIWHFGLKDDDGNAVEDDRGFPLDYWVFTSQSVGPKSNARPIAEALIGQAIDGMDGDAILNGVDGKSCQVKIADSYGDDGVFSGSRPVKGSWLALGAQRPGGQRATRPTGRPTKVAEEVPF